MCVPSSHDPDVATTSCAPVAHVATIGAALGDTVGDPCKDTAGPSLHVLIKLLSTVTLVMCPLFVGTVVKS